MTPSVAVRQRDMAGRPLDTRTALPDGSEVQGLTGLRDYLLEHRREEVLRQFCRKLLGYAIGRELKLSDQPLVCRDAATSGPKTTTDSPWPSRPSFEAVSSGRSGAGTCGWPGRPAPDLWGRAYGGTVPNFRCFLINIDAQDKQDCFRGSGVLYSGGAVNPHVIIARTSFPCGNLSSWLSCPSCLSMFFD